MKKIILALSIFVFAIQSNAQLDVVKTMNGLVSGTNNTTGDIKIFRGIPFAAPPVGDLRWKAPQPLTPWQGVKNCDAFSASPMQNKPLPFMMYTAEYLIPEKPISEDCLYLNVWTAAKSSKEKRPVIVWIYGGGFVSGGSACAIYDGEELAKKGVVFVSINYRVGVFGFLAHPDLTKTSGGKSSGNFALLDQVAALQWVKENIASFGGDPNRVTIAGQSAGAFSVNALMASPLTKGLFQRAIAESGGMFSADGRAINLKTAEENGVKFMQSVHANSIEEMRKMNADDLQKAASSFSASPVIDGYVLPTDVYEIFNTAKQNDVPLLTGWNGDEGFPPQTSPAPEVYRADAEKKYGLLAGEFLKTFPGTNADEIKKSQFALNRDNVFAWQNYTWAKMQTMHGKNRVFLYQFNHVSPTQEKWGAFHSSEICYALHTLHTWQLPFSDEDQVLEEVMSSYWANFAASGNPNGAGLSNWDTFDPKKPQSMVLNTGKQSMQPIAAQAELNFMDKYQDVLRKNK